MTDCLTCAAWLSRMFTPDDLTLIALDRGETVDRTRTALLTAYHAYHKETDS